MLIAAMVLKPATISRIRQEGDCFQDAALKKIATQLFSNDADKSGVNVASLPEEIPEDLARWIREMALTEGEENVWEKAVDDCLKKIGAKNLEKQVRTLNQKIASAETEGNEKELLKLLGQKKMLLERKPI